MHKQLKGDTLCPPDVSPVVVPMLVESPCPPLVADDDCQAMTGAGIGKGLKVECKWVVRDWDGGLGVQFVQPPV